jgi:hypothetical protein
LLHFSTFAALSSLGFLILHTFAMVVALDGYAKKEAKQVLFVLVLHLVAASLVSVCTLFIVYWILTGGSNKLQVGLLAPSSLKCIIIWPPLIL